MAELALAATAIGGALATPVGGALATGAITAGAGVAANALLAPDKPKLADPVAMPDPFGTEAKKAEEAKALKRRGRRSTILDEDDDVMPSYTNTELGQ